MNTKDIEKYIKVIKLDPNAKYILCVSKDSGISLSELCRVKLNEQFLDEVFLLEGNLDQVIKVIPTTK